MGSEYDFFSPFFRAAIIADPQNPEGSRYPLWMLPEGTPDPKGIRDEYGLSSLAFCSNITVKLNRSYVPKITATLTPPFEEGRKFLESPLIEWTRSALEVQFGYTNGTEVVLSPLYSGFLLPPSIEINTDSTITLNAQGKGGLSAIRKESDQVFTNTTRLDAIETVLRSHGLTVNIDDVQGTELQALKLKRESIWPANASDWQFALGLAKDCGCMVIQEGTAFKLIPIDALNAQAPKFKFRLFDFPAGQIGPKTGVFPILSVSTPTLSVFMSGATRGLRLGNYDSKTRKIQKPEVLDDKTSPVQRTGQGQVAPSDSPVTGDFFPVNGATQDGKEAAANEYKNSVNNAGTKIEIGSLGIPDLGPGIVVEVAGVAKGRLDGNYAVFDVTHSMGTDGYATDFTAVANVGQLGNTMDASLLATKTNTQTLNETAPKQLTNSTVSISAKPQ